MSASITWDIETPWTWKEYEQSVAQRLPPAFRSSNPDASRAVFMRALAGDVHTVELQLVALGPPTRVRATFLAYAD